MKRISIIGSTGFIGRQALQIIQKHKDEFKVVALTANSSADLLISQAKEFKPEYVGICNEAHYGTVKNLLNCTVGSGENCLTEAAQIDSDIVLVAVVGCIGLKSVIAAINNKTTVALANKESLVAAGELVTKLAENNGVDILPVDSEHSAVWQCLQAGRRKDLKRIILTASGGPFYNKSRDELKNVTPEQAVKHPTWNMGKKISVDSATMMNKGLEIIEARWLFDTYDIDYIIHPQSIIHSMVEFNDGALIAQLSQPDMKLPIQLAFSYPKRIACDIPEFGFRDMTFLPPKEDLFNFPLLAKKSLQLGGNAPCILNAANEAAVALFLNGKIPFLKISEIVEKTLLTEKIVNYETAEQIFDTHKSVFDKLMRDYN